MLIADIQDKEGWEECLSTSLGELTIRGEEGKTPEVPGPILEDKSNVTC